MTRRASAIGRLATLVVLTAGCTGAASSHPSASTTIPTGWTSYRYRGASISVPKDWTVAYDQLCQGSNAGPTLYLGAAQGTASCPASTNANRAPEVSLYAAQRGSGGTQDRCPAIEINGLRVVPETYAGPCTPGTADGPTYWSIPSLGLAASGSTPGDYGTAALGSDTIVGKVLRTLRKS